MIKAKTNMPDTSRLNREQVLVRLGICKSSKIAEEFYATGKMLLNDEQERIRTLEAKAIAIAAFGPAIITLLISNAQSWLSMGNGWTLMMVFLASICGLICTYLCIGVLSLQKSVVMSQDEWLKEELLNNSEMYLKRSRILVTWRGLDSYTTKQEKKAYKLQCALKWLAASTSLLVCLLFQLMFLHFIANHWRF